MAFERQFKAVNDSAAEAAKYYWEAEAHFRKRELNAKFPEGKTYYTTMAGWYAARGMRANRQAQLVIPSNLQTERERFREMLDAVKELQQFVRKDPRFFSGPADMEKSLAHFAVGYARLGELLGKWTDALTKGLTEKDLPGSPGNVAPAPTPPAESPPRPVKTASDVPTGGAAAYRR